MTARMILFFIFSQLISISTSFAQEKFYWDKELVPKVVVKEKEMIDKLLAALYIIDTEANAIEIYDVDQNGPSEGDLLKVNPSEQVHSLYLISREAQELLESIPVTPNVEKVGYTIDVRNPQTPEERILNALAYTIKTVYSPQKPMKLFFEQDEDGKYRFQLLGYSPEDLKDAQVNMGEKEIVDLLRAVYKEISEGPPTVIHVLKREKITLKVPEEK